MSPTPSATRWMRPRRPRTGRRAPPARPRARPDRPRAPTARTARRAAARARPALGADDMTTPRGFRDRADDSLFTLLGDIPELVRNLVVAEIDAAKKWLAKTAKDAGHGAGWFVGALLVLFWSLPVVFPVVSPGPSLWLGAPV